MKSFLSNLFKINSTSTTTTSTSTTGSFTTTSTVQSNRNHHHHQRASSFIDHKKTKHSNPSLENGALEQQQHSSPLKRKRNYSNDTLHDMLESYSPRSESIASSLTTRGGGDGCDGNCEKSLLKTPTTPDRSKQLKLTPPNERGVRRQDSSIIEAYNPMQQQQQGGNRSFSSRKSSSMMNPLGVSDVKGMDKHAREQNSLNNNSQNLSASKHVHGRSMSLKFLPGQLLGREDASNSSLQSPRLPSSPTTSTKQQTSPARSNSISYNPLEQFPQAYKGLEPFCIEASLAKLGKKFNEMIYKQTESWIQASNGEEEFKNASTNMKFTRDLLRMSHCMSIDQFEPVNPQQAHTRVLSNTNLSTLHTDKFKRIHDFSQIEDPTLRMIEIINATHHLFEKSDANKNGGKFCTLECYQDLTNTFQSQNVQPDDLVNVFRTLCVKRQRHQPAAASSQMSSETTSSTHHQRTSSFNVITPPEEKPHPMLKVLCLIDQSVVVGTLGQVAQCIMTLKNSISQLPQKEAAITIDQFKDIRGTWTVTFRDYGDKLSVLHQRTDCMLTKNNPKLFSSSMKGPMNTSNNNNKQGPPRSEFLELFHITWQVELFFNSRENPQFIQAIEVSLRDIDWTCSGSRDLHDENSTFMILSPEQRFEAERICRLFFSVKNEVKRFSGGNQTRTNSVLTQPVKCRIDIIPPHVPGVPLVSLSNSSNNSNNNTHHGLTSPRQGSSGSLTSPHRKATPSLRLNYNWFTKLFSSNSNSSQVEDVLAEYVVPTSTSLR
ncbi:hypothetical protein FDP41_011247 [Naegleria fowleri]|uniref:Uncharacterized protein n=1 Tax=Naegleria fowleri TaxID=5763 RepID=A0A6A5BYE9_NAEFO|nr:uncharacterized protein FDP41_011247 [Naegleria fowleri]KAF0982317.1 hypothetical protein FDP41_011247 [Naegleria fowleri]